MSSPRNASPFDGVASGPLEQVTVVEKLVPLLNDQLAGLGVDEAVAALDRAVQEEASDVGGPDTPARRAMLERRRVRLRALRVAVRVAATRQWSPITSRTRRRRKP